MGENRNYSQQMTAERRTKSDELVIQHRVFSPEITYTQTGKPDSADCIYVSMCSCTHIHINNNNNNSL